MDWGSDSCCDPIIQILLSATRSTAAVDIYIGLGKSGLALIWGF